jgi:hypothetical protein
LKEEQAARLGDFKMLRLENVHDETVKTKVQGKARTENHKTTARQDKTRQDKRTTRQTRQDKTRQGALLSALSSRHYLLGSVFVAVSRLCLLGFAFSSSSSKSVSYVRYQQRILPCLSLDGGQGKAREDKTRQETRRSQSQSQS